MHTLISLSSWREWHNWKSHLSPWPMKPSNTRMKKTKHTPCRSVLIGYLWPGGLLKPFVTSVGLYLEHFCGQGLGFHLCGFGLSCSGLCFVLHQEQQNRVPTSVWHTICEILHIQSGRILSVYIQSVLPHHSPVQMTFCLLIIHINLPQQFKTFCL